MAVVTVTITTTGTTNWVAPGGVTSVQVELWGAGGTGGSATGTASGAGGGSGGQYAAKQVTVVPGTTYPVVVPAASASSTNGVVNGADATFNSTTVVAKGGAGAAIATGTTGTGGAGSTTGGVGDTVFAGGNGANGVSSTSSGGGGSGAGSTGTGNNGSGGTAGAAKANNGGAGGNGVTSANTRNAGSNYGGGGSGGLSSSATDRAGGNGAQGLAVLTYTTPKAEVLTDTFATKDTVKWTWTAGTAVSGGKFTCTPGASNEELNTGNDRYDLSNSYLVFDVSQMLASTDQVLLGVIDTGTSADAFRFYKWTDGRLYFTELVGGVQNDSNVAWDSVNHKYMRLREFAGDIFFDTSADGISWTVQRTKAWAIPQVTSLRPFVTIGSGSGGVQFQMDDINVLPVQQFSMPPPRCRPNYYGSLLQL